MRVAVLAVAGSRGAASVRPGCMRCPTAALLHRVVRGSTDQQDQTEHGARPPEWHRGRTVTVLESPKTLVGKTVAHYAAPTVGVVPVLSPPKRPVVRATVV